MMCDCCVCVTLIRAHTKNEGSKSALLIKAKEEKGERGKRGVGERAHNCSTETETEREGIDKGKGTRKRNEYNDE